ncbi:hypothetical protein Tco_1080373 [Tanacetum coccineum]|uniref:Xylulose kinase-1 n=1 Tax=Tanacetum coccineum TaxID=301880 RepID=A0ABQ5HUI5_9ASTR
MVAFLAKPAESEGFEQIVDFFNVHTIKYALTINPTIYTSCIEQFWATVKAKTINGEVQLQALVDEKKIIITESIVRRDVQLKDDEGVDSDEAVNEEMEDSLVKAATTACSLEAEKYNGGGPMCQETMMDTIAQTRVLDLVTTKTTQATEIASLKRRVKKLERRNKSRTYGLKRLYSFGSSRRVESSEDEGLGEEDASKQGRIADINANKDIYLVNVQTDEDMFGVNDLDGDEVIVESVDVVNTTKETRRVVEEVTVVTIPVSDATTTTTTTAITDTDANKAKIDADYQLAQRLQAQEQDELTDEEKARLFVQFLEQKRKHFTAKRAEEMRNRPPTRA